MGHRNEAPHLSGTPRISVARALRRARTVYPRRTARKPRNFVQVRLPTVVIGTSGRADAGVVASGRVALADREALHWVSDVTFAREAPVCVPGNGPSADDSHTAVDGDQTAATDQTRS